MTTNRRQFIQSAIAVAVAAALPALRPTTPAVTALLTGSIVRYEGFSFHIVEENANTTWLGFDTRFIQGNFFIGLQGQTFNRAD